MSMFSRQLRSGFLALTAFMAAFIASVGWSQPPGVTAAANTGAEPLGIPDSEQAFQQGDFELAERLADNDLAAHPDNGQAALLLGRLEIYRNQLDRAEAHLRRAAMLLPGNASVKRLIETLRQRRGVAGKYRFSIPDDGIRIPFEATDPLPVLKVRVNSRRDAYFLLDTGAGNVVIDPDFAAELGIKAHADGTEGVFAGGQKAMVRTADLPELSLAGLAIQDIPVDVMPTRGFELLPGKRIDGIIGTCLLARFLSTIDYPHGELILQPRGKGKTATPISTARSAESVPMWLVGDHFLFVHGHLNNGPESLMNVDTGLAGGGFYATKRAIEQAHIALDRSHTEKGVGGGGSIESVPFTAAVQIGSMVENHLAGVFTPNGDPYVIFPFAVAGGVSHAYFRNFAVTFDFDAMRLVLTR